MLNFRNNHAISNSFVPDNVLIEGSMLQKPSFIAKTHATALCHFQPKYSTAYPRLVR